MDTRPQLRRPARLGLIFAALLHLLGGDFGAWLHFRDAAPLAAEAVAHAAETGDEQSPAPDHARHCAVCQTLAHGRQALPAGGTLPVEDERVSIPAHATGAASPLRRLGGAPSPARAPPALS